MLIRMSSATHTGRQVRAHCVIFRGMPVFVLGFPSQFDRTGLARQHANTRTDRFVRTPTTDFRLDL
jgi:hypothetical protein